MSERTRAGLAAARARGRRGGRKFKITAAELKTARALLKDPGHTFKDAAKAAGVSYIAPVHEKLSRFVLDRLA
jgi:DNA invertase Pin-like site-specific DNA recombinase